MGGLIVGEKKPYEYLVKSIENFVNQEELIALMEQNNFKKWAFHVSGNDISSYYLLLYCHSAIGNIIDTLIIPRYA